MNSDAAKNWLHKSQTNLQEYQLPFTLGSIKINVPQDPFKLLEEIFDEQPDEIYWAELWPSGLALADLIMQQTVISFPENDTELAFPVLEIGTGSGIVSIAAAKFEKPGYSILATDHESQSLQLAGFNATQNAVSDKIQFEQLDWNEPYTRKHALILAADCLYTPIAPQAVASFIKQALSTDKDARAFVADPNRWSSRNFKYIAMEQGLNVNCRHHQPPFILQNGQVVPKKEHTSEPKSVLVYELSHL